jgi:hypothetical protein
MGRTPIHPAFVALLSLALATPALADSETQKTTDLILDLAYDKCPAFVDGKLQLASDPVLTAQGFSPEVKAWTHPVSGPVEFRHRDAPELQVNFGGAAGRVCQLNMIGENAPALLSKVRDGLSRLPYKLEPDASRSGVQGNGANVETLRAVISEHEFVFVQFIRAQVSGKTMAGFQLKDMKI